MKLEDFFNHLQQAVNAMEARLKDHHLEQVKSYAGDADESSSRKLKTLTFELPGQSDAGQSRKIKIPTLAISPPRLMGLESVSINMKIPLQFIDGEVHVMEPSDQPTNATRRRSWFDKPNDAAGTTNPVYSEIEIMLKPTSKEMPKDLHKSINING
jgi:hypothetical protein